MQSVTDEKTLIPPRPESLVWAEANYRRFKAEYDSGENLEHPALRLGRTIYALRNPSDTVQARLTNAPNFDDQETARIIEWYTHIGLEKRAQKLANFIGSTNVDQQKAALKKIIREQCVYKPDGSKRTIKEFERATAHLFKEVFTGHPVFGMTVNQAGALSRHFTHLAGGGNYESARRELHESVKEEFKPFNLDQEAEQSYIAIDNAHVAIEWAEDIVINVAQEEYPDEWLTIDYMPYGVETWVKFDWDGRKGDPVASFAERVYLQNRMVEMDLIPRFGRLAEKMQGEDKAAVEGLITRLQTTLDLMKDHHAFFKNFKPEQMADLARHNREMAAEIEQGIRITHPSQLIDVIQPILDRTTDIEFQKELKKTISRLKNHGLTKAHIHSRLNSISTMDAMEDRVSGFDEISDTDTPADIDASLELKITKARAELEGKPAWPGHLGTMATATKTLDQILLLHRNIVRLVDSHSPIRLLQSDTETAVSILAIDYCAKGYGVDKHINVCKLHESILGIERRMEIDSVLLRNPYFIDHIAAPRPHELRPFRIHPTQRGFSDSNRYMGRTSAAWLDKNSALGLQAHAELTESEGFRAQYSEPGNVFYLDFPTHGEATGRNAHWRSVSDRIAHLVSAHNLNYARKHGIRYVTEQSFQGQDGFLIHGTPEASFAYLVQATAWLTADHSKVWETDPYYAQDRGAPHILGRKSVENFNRDHRAAHIALASSPEYMRYSMFLSNNMPVTGSRPRVRHEGGAAKLPRAIIHGGSMEGVDAPAMVTYGEGVAIRKNPELYAHMMKNSPTFEREAAILNEAFSRDPRIAGAYLGSLNPQLYDHLKKPAVSADLRHLGHYDSFKDVAATIAGDFELAVAERQRLNIPGDPLCDPVRQAQAAEDQVQRGLMHVFRIADLMDIYTRASEIPDFADNTHGNREKFVHRVVELDPKAPRELLEHVFRVSSNHLDGLDFGEPDDVSPANSGHADYSVLADGTLNPIVSRINRFHEFSRALMQHNGYVG